MPERDKALKLLRGLADFGTMDRIWHELVDGVDAMALMALMALIKVDSLDLSTSYVQILYVHHLIDCHRDRNNAMAQNRYCNDGPAGRYVYAAAAPPAAALAIRRSRRESLTGELVVVVGGHMHFCGR